MPLVAPMKTATMRAGSSEDMRAFEAKMLG
jgi:hypothetical protein